MSEFLQIVAIIGQVVIWSLDRSIDLLCAVLLISSMLLPWRFYEIKNTMGSTGDSWRVVAVVSFVLTMIDFVCVPLGVISLLSPLRVNVYNSINYDAKSVGSQFNFRYFLVYNFFSLLSDIIILMLCCFTLLSPLRFGKVWPILYKFYVNYEILTDDIYSTAIAQAVGTVCDIFAIPFLILIFTSPLRMLNLFTYVKERPQAEPYSAGELDVSLNRAIVNQGIGAVLDILSVFMSIFAVVSPLRCRNFFRAIIEILRDKTKREYYVVNENCFLYGIAGIIDILTIPLGLMACLSPIRAYGMKKEIDGVIMDELLCKVDQLNSLFAASFLLALSDLLVLPCFIIALLSATRTYVVAVESYDAIVKGHGVVLYSTYLNSLWIESAASAFVDVFCIIPGVITASIVPTCWVSAFYGSEVIRQTLLPSVEDRQEVLFESRAWYPLFSALRLHWLKQIPSAFVDVFAILFGVIALLSPMRHFAFRKAIYEELYESVDDEIVSGPELSNVVDNGTMEVSSGIAVMPSLVVVPPYSKSNESTTPILAAQVEQKYNLVESNNVEVAVQNDTIPTAPLLLNPTNDIFDKSSGEITKRIKLIESVRDSEEHGVLNPVPIVRQLDLDVAQPDNLMGLVRLGECIHIFADPIDDGFYRVVSGGYVAVNHSDFQWKECSELENDVSPSSLSPAEPTVSIFHSQTENSNSSAAIQLQSTDYTEALPVQQLLVPNSAVRTSELQLTRKRMPSFVYNLQLRRLCIYFGSMAIIDALMLPFLLPLWLTYYRYAPVRLSLIQASEWGLREFYVVLRQFLFLCIDFILLPLVLILFLTQLRWRPVAESIAQDDLCSETSMSTYGTVIFGGILLCLDILVFPLVSICFVTFYRFNALVSVWFSPTVFHNSLNFHFAVIVTSFIVCFDILFLVPLTLLSGVLSPPRLRQIFSIVITYCSKYFSQLCRAQEVIAASGLAADRSQSFVLLRIFSPTALDELAGYWSWADAVLLPNWPWRGELLQVGLDSALDFLFWPFVIVGICSIWRAKYVWRTLKVVLSAPNMKGREEYVIQVMLLVRDLLFVIPLSLLMITLVRFPRVFLALLAKLSSNAVAEDPIFKVKACRFEFPEVGGPILELKLTAAGSTSVNEVSALESNQNEHLTAAINNLSSPQISSKHKLELFASGLQFWRSIEGVFGSTIASIGRNFLPIRLDDSNLSITELNHSISVSEGGEFSIQLTLNFNFLKSVKRSTILKNLRKVDPKAIMVLQVDGHLNFGRKSSLFRICPTVNEFVSCVAFENSGVIAETILDDTSSRYSTALGSGRDVDDDSTSLVNSFYLIVGLEFIQLLTDFAYALLAFLSIISPIRFVQLIIQLFEPVAYRAIRIGLAARSLIANAELALYDYRRATMPILNTCSKDTLVQTRCAAASCRHLSQNFDSTIRGYSGRLEECRRRYLRPYQELCCQLLALLANSDNVQPLMLLCQDRLFLQDSLNFYGVRRGSLGFIFGDSDFPPELYGLVMACVTKYHNKTLASIQVNDRNIDNWVQDTFEKYKKEQIAVSSLFKRVKMCGIWNRPISESRTIVWSIFYQAILDIFLLFGFILLLLSGVKAIPLVRDMLIWRNEKGVYHDANHTGIKAILRKHFMDFAEDIKDVAKFLYFFILLCLLVVGLPAFVADAPNHSASFRALTICCRKHLQWSFSYFCEIFTLFLAWRSYRIVVFSAMYGILVPAACLAEAFPLRFCQVVVKFVIGLLAWTALLVGAGLATKSALQFDGDGSTNTSALFAYTMTLSALLLVAAITVSRRVEYSAPIRLASTKFKISWSHILAVITPPMETVQLSAVVLYFFWNGIYNKDAGVFASDLFYWGSNSSDSSYRVSVDIVAISCIVWAILVAIPLATHSSSSERRMEKLESIQNSPLYELLVVLLSRLFSVWIMATLMRATSCVAMSDSYVLSTDFAVSCGGSPGITGDNNTNWASLASLAILAYYLITTSVMHADDCELSKGSDGTGSSAVRFAPYYALIMRLLQFSVCALCLSKFGVSNTVVVLALIIIMCLIVAFIPLIGAAYGAAPLCSFQAMVPFRSGGILCVAWTAILCALRSSNHAPEWANSTALFAGWGIISLLSLVVSYFVHQLVLKSWMLYLQESGLQESVNLLLQSVDNLLVDEAVLGVTTNASVRQRLIKYKGQVEASLSSTQLALVLLELEDQILVDKLSSEFIRNRQSWLNALNRICHIDSDRATAVGLHNSDFRIPENSSQSDFARISECCMLLSSAIRPSPSGMLLSRGSLAIMLSRKLPIDVCWHIYSFCLAVAPIQEVMEPWLERDEVAKGFLLGTRKKSNQYFVQDFLVLSVNNAEGLRDALLYEFARTISSARK